MNPAKTAMKVSVWLASVMSVALATPALADVTMRGKVTLKNTTGEDANDVHFKINQKEPWIQMKGASASGDKLSGSSVGLGDRSDKPVGDGNDHEATIDLTGGPGESVGAGEELEVDVEIVLSERNTLHVRDVVWTKDGVPIGGGGGGGGGGGKGPGGMKAGRPRPGGGGGGHPPVPPGGPNPIGPNGAGRGGQAGDAPPGDTAPHKHRFEIHNNDHRPMLVSSIKLYITMTDFADLKAGIPWDSVAVLDLPYPIRIEPGEVWSYDFETTGAYAGGHIYFWYDSRYEDPLPPAQARGRTLGADADEAPDAGVIGDHPIEDVLLDMTGPSAITDLSLAGWDGLTLLTRWTSPTDAGGSDSRATAYHLKYMHAPFEPVPAGAPQLDISGWKDKFIVAIEDGSGDLWLSLGRALGDDGTEWDRPFPIVNGQYVGLLPADRALLFRAESHGTPFDWDAARGVAGLPIPGPPGANEHAAVEGLMPNADYVVACRSRDADVNVSPFGNVLKVHTPPLHVLFSPEGFCGGLPEPGRVCDDGATMFDPAMAAGRDFSYGWTASPPGLVQFFGPGSLPFEGYAAIGQHPSVAFCAQGLPGDYLVMWTLGDTLPNQQQLAVNGTPQPPLLPPPGGGVQMQQTVVTMPPGGSIWITGLPSAPQTKLCEVRILRAP